MNDIFIPITLAVAGLISAIVTYRAIRRGGARFYTLEREAILRRASLSLFSSVLLFAAAIGLLIYERQQGVAEGAAAFGEFVEGVVTSTPTPDLEQFPPTATVTATPDPAVPTITPTAIICRAAVEGTSGNGLTLRDEPNGERVEVLAEGDLVTLLPDAPVESNGITWRKVNTLFGDEGWVAQDFLRLGSSCE